MSTVQVYEMTDIIFNPPDWLETIYYWGSEWQAVKLDNKSQKLYKNLHQPNKCVWFWHLWNPYGQF